MTVSTRSMHAGHMAHIYIYIPIYTFMVCHACADAFYLVIQHEAIHSVLNSCKGELNNCYNYSLHVISSFLANSLGYIR